VNEYGLDLGRQKAEEAETDWVFGGVSVPGLADIPHDARTRFLPMGELQFGAADFQDCATRSPLNDLEAQFTYLYQNNKLLEDNRLFLELHGYVNDGRITFSDRFTAVLSGTTRQGNSLKAPLDAIRKHGLIPKSMLPKQDGMSWEDYHKPTAITPKMRSLGAEFAQRFSIFYEKVYPVHLAEALKDHMVGVAGHAWPTPVNGIYPRTNNQINHAFLLYSLPKYQAFDNYLDEYRQDDFTKSLAPDFAFFDYAYRVYIGSQQLPAGPSITDALNALKLALDALLAYLLDQKASPAKRLYTQALKHLGRDASPNDEAPDELGCADSVQEIYKAEFGRYVGPIKTNATWVMKGHLDASPNFKKVDTPQAGDIIISETRWIGDVQQIGHVGICGPAGVIYSNNSFGRDKGTFTANFTQASWKASYQTKKGLKVTLYRPI